MRVIEILLVEDDELDRIDIRRTFDKQKILYRLHEARNGEEALRYLKGADPLPDLMLLDINMPRMNGLELLKVIRQSQEWKNLKCFIITTSEERVDKEEAKMLGVSGYIVKPLKLNTPSSMDAFNLMIDLLNIKV